MKAGDFVCLTVPGAAVRVWEMREWRGAVLDRPVPSPDWVWVQWPSKHVLVDFKYRSEPRIWMEPRCWLKKTIP